MNKLFAFLLPMWIACSVSAQKNWTLEDCIRYSLDNNLQIKRQVLNATISEESYKQSKMEFLPSVNGSYSHTISTGRALNTDSYTWEDNTIQNGSLGLSANLTLFKGFQNYNNMKSEEYTLLSSQQLTEKLKNDISVNIAMLYLQILFDRELALVAEQQLEVSRLQADRVSKLVDAGSKARGELLEILAQVASDEYNLVNARNRYTLARLDLLQLLDLDSLNGFDIVVPSDAALQIDTVPAVDSIYTMALTIMPEIKSAEFSSLAAQKQVKYARGFYSPELYITGGYYTRYEIDGVIQTGIAPDNTPLFSAYPIADQLQDKQYRSVSLGLNIPIYNKHQVHSNVAKARIRYEDSKVELRQAQLTLYKDIQQAYTDAMAAKSRYESARKAVDSNQEALKYTTEKYNVGISNALDFNEAKKNAFKANSDLLQAKYEYLFKLKILDFYAGKSITLTE